MQYRAGFGRLQLVGRVAQQRVPEQVDKLSAHGRIVVNRVMGWG
jgi:hypothetical protein